MPVGVCGAVGQTARLPPPELLRASGPDPPNRRPNRLQACGPRHGGRPATHRSGNCLALNSMGPHPWQYDPSLPFGSRPAPARGSLTSRTAGAQLPMLFSAKQFDAARERRLAGPRCPMPAAGGVSPDPVRSRRRKCLGGMWLRVRHIRHARMAATALQRPCATQETSFMNLPIRGRRGGVHASCVAGHSPRAVARRPARGHPPRGSPLSLARDVAARPPARVVVSPDDADRLGDAIPRPGDAHRRQR